MKTTASKYGMRLLVCVLLAATAGSATAGPDRDGGTGVAKASVRIFADSAAGPIKELNGGNLAPPLMDEEMPGCDIRESFSRLNIPITRLHDAPLENAGMRVVDIPLIFANFHADANDPRNYYFDQTDDYIRNCVASGTQVYYRLGTSIEHSRNKYFTDPPSDAGKWIDVVSNVIRHYTEGKWNGYRYDIEYWEIWNEPNLGENRTNYDAYASLLSHTVETIRRVQPDAVIIGMGLSRMPLGYTEHVLDLLRERGQLGMIDYVSFHPYHENPDDATPGIEALARLVKSYDPDIRLFQGESGCPATLEWAHALRYYEWNEYSQAKWVARRMANDWMMGIRSSIFTFVDLQYPNMQQSFGLLRTNLFKEVVYKRPSFHAVQHMVNLFRPELRSAGRLNHESNTPRRLTVAGIERQKDGTLVGAVVWQNDRIPSDNLAFEPIELWIEGLTLKDPVLIEMITGRIYALPKYHGHSGDGRMKFTGLPVWDSPVVILERSALPEGTQTRERQISGSTRDMHF